jgi:hypothetical protein
MSADMYDGVRSLAPGIARQFPKLRKVAGYVNGHYAWGQAEWNLFPHADHVTITVTADANAGDVLDVEVGDAKPDQAAGWIAMRKAAGLYRPTIYCSRLVIPAVRTGTGRYVLGRDYDIWVADYTGQPHAVTAPGPGAAVQCAATQYENTADWDASMIYADGWPFRTPPGPAAPAGLSGTVHQAANFSCSPVDDPATGQPAAHYEWEVWHGTPARPVERIAHAITDGPHAAGVVLGLPAPMFFRARAVGGAWSAKVLER